MRILIVSDIHSNLVALEAVLANAGKYDALWCLGDTVGYGSAPNECAEAMKEHAAVVVSGNHDLACIDKVDLDDFNPDARRANLWNGKQLTKDNRAWLAELSAIQRIDERFTAVHASPREPIWEYLLTPEQAIANFSYFETQICFMGHSHVQLSFRFDGKNRCERSLPSHGEVLRLENKERYFINPGSVGQPRDYDPRAAYAILDTTVNTVGFYRVEYDINATQQQMREVDLPVALVRRLTFGV